MRHIVDRARIAMTAGFLLAFTALSCNTAPQMSTPGATLVLQRLVALNAAGEESDLVEIELGNEFWPVPQLVDSIGLATLINPAETAIVGQVVILSRYRVSWIRDDGKAQQGLDVPYAFEGMLDAVVGPSDVASLRLILVRAIALTEPPFVQFAGGSETLDMRGILNVTLSGRDQSGTPFSVTGAIPFHVFRRG